MDAIKSFAVGLAAFSALIGTIVGLFAALGAPASIFLVFGLSCVFACLWVGDVIRQSWAEIRQEWRDRKSAKRQHGRAIGD